VVAASSWHAPSRRRCTVTTGVGSDPTPR
jgi:hypothetical protein